MFLSFLFLSRSFSGEDKIRSVLSEVTKSEDLLKKTIMPPRRVDRKAKPPNAVAARSGQPPKHKSGGQASGSGAKYQHKEKFKKKRKEYEEEEEDSAAPASKKKQSMGGKKKFQNKSEFVSPLSFSEAWPAFFSSTAILMVTAIGLFIDNIPTLDKMPLGGRLRHCIPNWNVVCNNKWVKNVVEFGYKIPLKYFPSQQRIPVNPTVSDGAHDVMVKEAIELKNKQAVVVASHEPGEYISSYFAVPKPRSPGKFRPILNLKFFNKCVKKYKFTMESLKAIRDWIKPGSWCVGLDLKDAFPHIPIHKDSRKYLRFKWLGELLQWIALPFGLTCSPRVITKVIKPIMAFLRATWAILISVYIDDMLIQARAPSEAILHAQIVMLTMMALGWSFNWEKSNLIPSQQVVHLGFLIDTKAMTLTCPKDKVVRLQNLCSTALSDEHVTVHNLERMLGTMESVRPSTPLAPLHYRGLQRQLLRAKVSERQPNLVILLSKKSLLNLRWWVAPSGFAGNCSTFLQEEKPTVDIWSDANLNMGGARNSRGEWSQRAWSVLEKSQDPHINLLEIRAAREGLALAVPGDKVRPHLDSTTACFYIKNQGGTKGSLLSKEACLMWEEAIARDITILTPHWLSTGDNAEADFLTRNTLSQWDFRLDRDVFCMILETFQVRPTLDAFASSNTAQLPRYMTWYPDRNAVARDALLHPWDRVTYLFPPVPLLLKVIMRIRQQQIRAVLVCPQWPTSLWWPLVLEMLVEPLLPLPHYKSVLTVVEGGPIQPYLDPLVALHLSGENMA